jgi:lysophospholipase L1-like esterase
MALLLATGMLPARAADGDTTSAPAPRSSYCQERSSFFRSFGRPADVVMLGDSLTDGAEWQEMFAQPRIVNRGIDGDTTDGVLERVADVLALRPQVVFVMIGINDFAEAGRSVDAVFASYRAIVAALVKGGARVVVQSTLPCHEAKAAWKSCRLLNEPIRQLNARLATLASNDVVYLDLAALLGAGGELRGEFTIDGVHLNGDGYRRWRDAIAPLMPARRRP